MGGPSLQSACDAHSFGLVGYLRALRKADVAYCACVCFVGLTISWFSTHFNQPARTMVPTMSRVLWCLRVPFVTPGQHKVCVTMIRGSVEEQRFPRMQVYILAHFVVPDRPLCYRLAYPKDLDHL